MKARVFIFAALVTLPLAARAISPEDAYRIAKHHCLYRLVKDDMSRDDVLALLGPPQRTAPQGALVWEDRYSKWNWARLELRFNADGHIGGTNSANVSIVSNSTQRAEPIPTLDELKSVGLHQPIRAVVERIGPFSQQDADGTLCWEVHPNETETDELKLKIDPHARVSRVHLEKATTIRRSSWLGLVKVAVTTNVVVLNDD